MRMNKEVLNVVTHIHLHVMKKATKVTLSHKCQKVNIKVNFSIDVNGTRSHEYIAMKHSCKCKSFCNLFFFIQIKME